MNNRGALKGANAAAAGAKNLDSPMKLT